MWGRILCVDRSSRKSISSPTSTILRRKRMTMRRMRRMRSPHPTMTRPLPPALPTPVHPLGGAPSAAGTPSTAPLTPLPCQLQTRSSQGSAPAPVTSPPPGDRGPAAALPPQAARGRCSLGGAGTPPPGPSPPAVVAVPPPAASPQG